MSNALLAFTLFHVVISLVGIATGFVVIGAMIRSRDLPRWTAWFLAATVATSITGFMFPFHGFKPSYVLGVLSLLALGPAIWARYNMECAGPWRWVYVVGSVTAQYFNFFVLIVQSFLHIPVLRALAPTQAEPPFAIAQLTALVAFLVLGTLATRRYHPLPVT